MREDQVSENPVSEENLMIEAQVSENPVSEENLMVEDPDSEENLYAEASVPEENLVVENQVSEESLMTEESLMAEEDLEADVSADKFEHSVDESHDDQKISFDDIKSRLRPRNPINYNQVIVHGSPSTPVRVKTKTPRKIVKNQEVKHNSVKRKITDESKKAIFLLPANKRRRRASETDCKVNKMSRSRRKSGIEIMK